MIYVVSEKGSRDKYLGYFESREGAIKKAISVLEQTGEKGCYLLEDDEVVARIDNKGVGFLVTENVFHDVNAYLICLNLLRFANKYGRTGCNDEVDLLSTFNEGIWQFQIRTKEEILTYEIKDDKLRNVSSGVAEDYPNTYFLAVLNFIEMSEDKIIGIKLRDSSMYIACDRKGKVIEKEYIRSSSKLYERKSYTISLGDENNWF